MLIKWVVVIFKLVVVVVVVVDYFDLAEVSTLLWSK